MGTQCISRSKFSPTQSYEWKRSVTQIEIALRSGQKWKSGLFEGRKMQEGIGWRELGIGIVYCGWSPLSGEAWQLSAAKMKGMSAWQMIDSRLTNWLPDWFQLHLQYAVCNMQYAIATCNGSAKIATNVRRLLKPLALHNLLNFRRRRLTYCLPIRSVCVSVCGCWANKQIAI